jgi:dihydroxyacetone kinase-like predicted kinase
MPGPKAQAGPVRALNAEVLREVLRAMLGSVREHEEELNRLNVFPVRDHDTGTNMSLTLYGVVKASDAASGSPMRELARDVVDAATMEARGNSGTILAEILRGLFETWAADELIGPDLVAAGLAAAADRAQQSVLEPVEGTILTVARAAADAIAPADGDANSRVDGDVAELLAVAADAAGRAVEATTGQLAALRRAGVVDAAAKGYELCLRAFAATVAALPEEPGPPEPAAATPTETHAGADGAIRDHGATAEPEPGALFEVQYLVACGQRDAEELGQTLAAIGDSIVVAGDDGRYRVHVHTRRAGAAIEAGIDHGRISQVEVSYLGAAAG